VRRAFGNLVMTLQWNAPFHCSLTICSLRLGNCMTSIWIKFKKVQGYVWADQDWIGLQKICWSGLDRTQFFRIETGLGLTNFTVCSSLPCTLTARSSIQPECCQTCFTFLNFHEQEDSTQNLRFLSGQGPTFRTDSVFAVLHANLE